MTLIADITIPADRFELGRVLQGFPEIEIELERIVPLQEPIAPLVWISGADEATVKDALRDHSKVRSVDVLTDTHDAVLFEVEWSPKINGLVRTLIETEAKILEATGEAEQWDFRIRFPTHENLTSFNRTLTDDGIPVTLRHLYNPVLPDERPQLSVEQHEALILAYHRGYFEVPRRVSLVEIAESMEISDSALSQRLRRGFSTLIKQELIRDE